MLSKTLPNGTEIKFYASVKEMPIKLHNLTQRYLLLDMGIGSDMNAIDERFSSLDGFLSAGKLEDALQERENQRFAFYTMLQCVSYKSLAFGCHIHSIGGIAMVDYSEENIQSITDGLDMTMLDMEETLEDLKKNFALN